MDDEKNHLKFWCVTLISVALIVALGWFGRSTYRRFKEKHTLTEAKTFLAHGDYRNAFLSARQTLLINSNNVEACRVMAALEDVSGSPAAIDWRQRIATIQPTVENKLMVAAAGLRYQSPPFPVTTQVLDELSATATNVAAFHSVFAELDTRLNRLAAAQMHLEKALQLEPTNQLIRLRLTAIQLGSTNPPVVAAARATLEKFESNTNLKVAALRLLVAGGLLRDDLAGARSNSAQLLADPRATTSDRLQYVGILRRMNDPQFPAQLKLLQQSVTTHAAAAAQTASWMTANGLAPEATVWLTYLPSKIQDQQPVRLARVDGYIAQTNWMALRNFASAGNWGEMDFLRLAVLSRALAQTGEPVMADGDWQAAIGEAGSRPGALTVLVELTESWKMTQKRDDLLWQIVQKFPRQNQARQELARDYFLAGETRKLNRLYSFLLPHFPNDPEIKNNLAATSLLLKTNLPAAFQRAREVSAQMPDNSSYMSTYAYALDLQGRPREGVAALEKLDDNSLKRPSTALYYGVLLSALGEKKKAAPFLDIAKKDGRLLPEEKRLLSQALEAK